MKIRNVLAATTAATAMFAGAAIAESHGTMKIGITQNNVGVDSYQTTYEQAFIAAAEDVSSNSVHCTYPADGVAERYWVQSPGGLSYAQIAVGTPVGAGETYVKTQATSFWYIPPPFAIVYEPAAVIVIVVVPLEPDAKVALAT